MAPTEQLSGPPGTGLEDLDRLGSTAEDCCTLFHDA
jgi:hypothetical protein